MSHFKGKDALHHLVDARRRGFETSIEWHGSEVAPSFYFAAITFQETALLALLFLFLETPFAVSLLVAWVFFKSIETLLIGYNRLDRLHRLIEEEQYEIEHHLDEEKEELTALWKARGLSGKTLHEVVETLSSDQSRLLEVMLVEEMGLKPETFEHPLFQGIGSMLGGGVAIFLIFLPFKWALGVSVLGILLLSFLLAKKEKGPISKRWVWNVALLLAAIAFAMGFHADFR